MSDELMSELRDTPTEVSGIMVIGVGGAGGNAVNHMWNLGIKGVNFIVCNTDQQSLNKSPVETKISLGTDGLGAGSNPEIGRRAAIETLDLIRQRFVEHNTRMIFITAGMGGGTGTGASPVIAKLAKEMDILTVAVVTSPLAAEGDDRYNQAYRGIDELRQWVDSLLIINNENILGIYGRLSLRQAFGKADDILASAVKGIAEIITIESDGVNVDFRDVRRVMLQSGRAHMSVVSAEGEDRAQVVADESFRSPLLDNMSISGAKNILLNIVCASSDVISYEEVVSIISRVQQHATVVDENGTVHTANIIWGTSPKPGLGDVIELIVVATGFDDAQPSGQTMKQIIHAHTAITPSVQSDAPAILQPPKPKSTAQHVAARQPEQVVLGAKSARYNNIDTLISRPAYQRREAQFIPQMPTGRKVVLKAEENNETRSSEPTGGSLFD